MIRLIGLFTLIIYTFYILNEFNLPNIDLNITISTYNDCHINFVLKIFLHSFDSPAHKDGNILDLTLCDSMGLDRVKFHSVGFLKPMLKTTAYSFLIRVYRGTKPTSRSLYLDFYRAKLDYIIKFLSEIKKKVLYDP